MIIACLIVIKNLKLIHHLIPENGRRNLNVVLVIIVWFYKIEKSLNRNSYKRSIINNENKSELLIKKKNK